MVDMPAIDYTAAVGGYFGLELPDQGTLYHDQAAALNTGRNAFEYILRSRKQCRHVYLPAYICDTMLEPIRRLNLSWSWYEIDERFRPLLKHTLSDDEILLYVNYFGLQEDLIQALVSTYGEKLVVDATHAFYFAPPLQIDVFYSARKFFGVPDGAFAYSNLPYDGHLDFDVSHHRCSYLLKRHDTGAEQGYEDFKRIDDTLSDLPLRRMSRLTSRLLRSIDYKAVRLARQRNFLFLHERFGHLNRLDLPYNPTTVPMVYPFLIADGEEFREKLICRRIYVATYWPQVPKRVKKDSVEAIFSRHLLCLPVDQRYTLDDMQRIIDIIKRSACRHSLSTNGRSNPHE